MTDRQLHPDEGIRAESAVARAELAMARRVDGRFEQVAGNGVFVTMIVMYVVMAITGAWLRTLVIPQRWEVAAACISVAVLAWALRWLSWVSGRKPPGWVRAAETCEKALNSQIPAPAMAVVSQAVDRVRQRSRHRWHGTYVYLSRCTRLGPPDNGMCQNAGVVPMSGRLVIVIGEHMTEVPQVAAAVLAHEGRHVTSVRIYLTYLIMLSRLLGWVIIGWAVPWPSLLHALLVFHVAVTMLSWAVEASCDLGGATEVGPGAMLATLDHLRQTDARINKDRSRKARYTRRALLWVAGPFHPPLPLRQVIVGLRWPQASVRDGG